MSDIRLSNLRITMPAPLWSYHTGKAIQEDITKWKFSLFRKQYILSLIRDAKHYSKWQ